MKDTEFLDWSKGIHIWIYCNPVDHAYMDLRNLIVLHGNTTCTFYAVRYLFENNVNIVNQMHKKNFNLIDFSIIIEWRFTKIWWDYFDINLLRPRYFFDNHGLWNGYCLRHGSSNCSIWRGTKGILQKTQFP